jgi:hypothetical protein
MWALDSVEHEYDLFEWSLGEGNARSVFRIILQAGVTGLSGKEILQRMPLPSQRSGRKRQVETAVGKIREELDAFTLWRRGKPDWYWILHLRDARGGEGYRVTAHPVPRRRSQQHSVRRGEVNGTAWGPLYWRCKGRWQPEIPIKVWLPEDPRDNLIFVYDVGEPWSEPADALDYPQHRDRAYKRITKGRIGTYNGRIWRVADVIQLDERRLRLDVGPCEYADYCATNLSLDDEIIAGRGDRVKVLEWAAPSLRARQLCYVLPSANPLSVNVLLLTSDNWIAVVKQRSSHTQSADKWVASISGTVDQSLENTSLPRGGREPDPVLTAVHEAHQEAGAIIHPAQVHWVAFGIGLKKCTACILGEVVLNEKRDTVRDMFEHRSDQSETELIDFVQLEPQAVLNALNDETRFPHGSFFKLGLALSLVRRGLADVALQTPGTREKAPRKVRPAS